MKNKKGITLIALVITIIILLILAGIVINLTIGEKGILNMAKNAKNEYQNSQDTEEKELENIYNDVNNYLYDEMVRAIKKDVTVSRGEDKKISDLFFIKQSSEIESIKYINETKEDQEIENTKELLAGKYIINCIVTKKDKTQENAKVNLTVSNILYVTGTRNIDEYLGEELTIVGNSDDATIITTNAYYFTPNNNMTFENLTIDVNAIAINTNNIKVIFKNCKLNLSGYNASSKKAGIVANAAPAESSLYFEKCIFQTENSKIFDSWATTNINAYIKKDCIPNTINEFTTCVTATGRKSWILNSYE